MCSCCAVSPDREVLQRTTFVREEQYLTFVKAEFEVVGSHSAECMCAESKVIEEQNGKVECPLPVIKFWIVRVKQ